MNEIHTVDMNKVYTDSELMALGRVLNAALEALKATYALTHRETVEQKDRCAIRGPRINKLND